MNTDPEKSHLFPFAAVGATLAAMACAFAAHAGSLAVKMLPGERWWGLCNNFGREMPFTESSDFSCDLRLDNYSHQALSFLCSDKGRAIWCAESVGDRRSLNPWGTDSAAFTCFHVVVEL